MLSFRQFLALALLPLVGMMACDFPVPPAGSGSTVTELPDLSGATVVSGELTDSDAARSNGAKIDEVATVTVAPGRVLHVLMESTSFDTFLELSVVGTEVTFTNDDWGGSRSQSFISRINESDVALTVSIGASGFATSNRGAYTVRYLVEEAASPSPGPATGTGRPQSPPLGTLPQAVPGSARGTLTSSTPGYPLLSNGDVRPAATYAISLQSGQTATIRMESSDFDTYLVVDREGEFVARNDDFGGSRSVSQLVITAPTGGTYIVYAGAFSAASNTGSYSLTFTTDGSTAPAPTPTPSPESSRRPTSGQIDGFLSDDDAEIALTLAGDLRKADAYTVVLQSGQTVVITMESTAFDTYLLLSFGDQTVARNDDAGSTRRSEIRYTASQAGPYTFNAGTFTSTGRGSYTIDWRVE